MEYAPLEPREPEGECNEQLSPAEDQLSLLEGEAEVSPAVQKAPKHHSAVWKMGGPLLCLLALISASVILYQSMQPKEQEVLPILTLALEVVQAEPSFFQRLLGQVVGEEKGVPVHKVTAEDVIKGFRAPTDVHIRFQCPETAGILARVALGDPRADEETLFWAYAYTEQEKQNIKDDKKGREAFNGDFYLSLAQRRVTPQYASLHKEEFTMLPGRHYYLMVDGKTARSSFPVACYDRDKDGWNDGEDLDGDGSVDPGETNPADADTDDDGILDGEEPPLGTNPVKNDTDDDGLLDGTELGYKRGHSSGTDPHVFIPDADPGTTTDPLKTDTDGGGESDGSEDGNRNGMFEVGERDPRNPADDKGCGNGTREKSEACDDGNTTAGDGCDATCTVEPGFTCTGEPSVCTGS